MNITNREFFRDLTIGALTAAFVLLSFIGYWAIRPYHILTNIKDVKIMTPIVKPGENVILSVYACKNYDLPELTSRELIDGFVFTLPPVQVFEPEGCHETYVAIQIPTTTPNGHYRIKSTSEFRPNILRFIYYSWTTGYFEVIK